MNASTDKYKCYENIRNEDEITIFVGVGLNDAPVLKRADIGVTLLTILNTLRILKK